MPATLIFLLTILLLVRTYVWSPSVTPATLPVGAEDLRTEALLTHTAVPERDLYELTQRVKLRSDRPIRKVVNATTPDHAVGEREQFWVADQGKKSYYTIAATLLYRTPHLYMYVEDGQEVDMSALRQAAETFESHIYPTDRRYFGSEWNPGIDNDPHITVLNARIPDVGGYFSSADEYPHEVNPHSNEREMIYLNLESARPGDAFYEATMAHEFTHMIQWNADRNEDAWINEGLATLAMELNGYSTGGVEVAFARVPNTQLTTWQEDANKSVPHYGASYLFLRYFMDRFGGADATRALVEARDDGAAGVDEALRRLGSPLTFGDVFRDWLVANYIDDPDVAAGRYEYRGKDVKVATSRQVALYPSTASDSVAEFAARYVALERGRGDTTVSFRGDTRVKLVDNDPHSGNREWWSNRGDVSDMTLTRAFDLRAVKKATLQVSLWYDIEDGFDYAYIEVSRDGGNTWTTLQGQHTTDTNPNGANLGHGYTGVSGGASREAWRGLDHTLQLGSRLALPASTQRFALLSRLTSLRDRLVGFVAHQAARPQWVEEQLDLTPFAGNQILLRFEYVTDDVYTGQGLTVDDVRIPELGFRDDAESENGWQARGFVLTNNYVPQQHTVQVITMGEQTTVQQMHLDALQRGNLVVKDLGGVNSKAVLVIAALAPKTTMQTSFEYSAEPIQREQ